MFLNLLKRAVKAALWDAVEEWALECGLPRAAVEEMSRQRLALVAQAEATADARAALALGVEDDMVEPHALPMPSAARITIDDAGDGETCPPPGDEPVLLRWVHRQRECQTGWADIVRIAVGAGHDVGEDALRMRYRRWREKINQPKDASTPIA
jgi:hypothetical protein